MARQYTQEYTNARLPLWRESMAPLEWAALHWSPAYLGIGVRRGHGEPVVVVPGFMASDAGLAELKCWLDRMGFAAYYSGIGRNVKCPCDHVKTIVETVERAFRETGKRVTVVGHSLGGCLARGAAMERAGMVERVITLGSPVAGARVHPLIFAAGEAMHSDCDESCFLLLQAGLPASVEEVRVYSKTDGIVDTRACGRSKRGQRPVINVEVRGTHIGMIWNAAVYREIARAVARPQRAVGRGRLRLVAA